MTNQILPLIIAILMTFSNKSALVEQIRLQQYREENKMNTHDLILSTVRATTKLNSKHRLVRYYIFTDDNNNNRVIFGMIFADSDYVNENCVLHYIKNTYDQNTRLYQRCKTDNILNETYSVKVYTSDNKKFYMERNGGAIWYGATSRRTRT